MKLTDLQLEVIEGRLASFPGETWEQIVTRVVEHVLQDEMPENRSYYRKGYTWLLSEMIFLPNSPCLRNFGANGGSGSACFVLPIEDNRRSIFETLADAVDVQAFGGGTGFNFSALRPEGARIASTNGVSSGPVSFMQIYDFTLGTVIKQGGVRNGASMGILNCDHPDIFKFLDAKSEEGRLSNFNISVGVTDAFMEAVRDDGLWKLRHGGHTYSVLRARALFDRIIEGIHKNGEPGMVFLDTINRGNDYVEIEATNPCGEQPLPPYTSCVLGSINLAKWHKLNEAHQDLAIRLAVRFLDSVINVNPYPIRKIEERTKYYRNIGLGVMGFADLCIDEGIIYGSKECLELINEIGDKMKRVSLDQSAFNGDAKGNAPVFGHGSGRRNLCVLSIAPTGTLSMVADCSSGIEPLYARSFKKLTMGKHVIVKNKMVEKYGEYSPVIVTAGEVDPFQHITVQAEWQKHVDAAISKTINVANNITKDEIGSMLIFAWENGCKGLTIYRDGSRTLQAQVSACPECGEALTKTEGCETCHSCGWSKCSLK